MAIEDTTVLEHANFQKHQYARMDANLRLKPARRVAAVALLASALWLKVLSFRDRKTDEDPQGMSNILESLGHTLSGTSEW